MLSSWYAANPGSTPGIPFPTRTFLHKKVKEGDCMNSFISWIGGKKLLRKKILELFPESYTRYIEVFGGAGWVLFAEERKVELEVYNDVNSNLVNLYRIIKYHPEALQKELQYILMSRELFFDAAEQCDVRGMTDIQRAARFFITIRESYGNTLKTFGCISRDMSAMVEYLTKVSKRLNRVVIENQDFARILKTYDRPGTLFYLDPPYYDAEKYYPDRFQPEDHERLRDSLEKIQGKFLLSYNDCPEIRKLYAGYRIEAVERSNNLVTKFEGRRYKELLIQNY